MAGVGRRLAALTLDNVADVMAPCRQCRFWTYGPAAASVDDGARIDDWLSEVLLQWGSCGQIAYVSGDPVGHALYAPPGYLGGAGSFATSPIAGDAVLLARLQVADDHEGAGLGRLLVQGVARDLVRRHVRAIEAFGWRGRAHPCLLPADFLLAVGFRTVRPHPHTPRLRLDLKSTLSWREDVESAWGAIVGSLRTPAPARQLR